MIDQITDGLDVFLPELPTNYVIIESICILTIYYHIKHNNLQFLIVWLKQKMIYVIAEILTFCCYTADFRQFLVKGNMVFQCTSLPAQLSCLVSYNSPCLALIYTTELIMLIILDAVR